MDFVGYEFDKTIQNTEYREQKFTQSVNLTDEVRFKTPFDKAKYCEGIFGVA